jgi:hypothetical protein
MVPIATTYYGLFAGLFLYLSFLVISRRRATKTPLGAGEDVLLSRRIRAHANFAEYVPLALLLLLLCELNGSSALLLNALYLALLTGRTVHAYAIIQEEEPIRFRILGMQLTLATIGIASVTTILQAFL